MNLSSFSAAVSSTMWLWSIFRAHSSLLRASRPDRADARTAEGVGELGGTCHADEAVVVLRVGLEELVQRFLAALAYAVVASERITSNSWVR
jgi:hypothetical protein